MGKSTNHLRNEEEKALCPQRKLVLPVILFHEMCSMHSCISSVIAIIKSGKHTNNCVAGIYNIISQNKIYSNRQHI